MHSIQFICLVYVDAFYAFRIENIVFMARC